MTLLRLPPTLPLVALLAVHLAGCAGAATNPAGASCVPACIAPQVCDPVRRVCITQSSNPCTGTTSSCRGACVDTTRDPSNCGGCGNACGFNADCISAVCTCRSAFQNCDGYWSNGCECSGGCLGQGCAPPPTPVGCSPDNEGDCDVDKYCDITVKQCQPCPLGQKNCDQRSDCECQGDSCDGKRCKPPAGQCDPAAKGACGGVDAFCNADTQTCLNCAKGWINCDQGAYCECAGLCNGDTCATCEAGTVGACDAVGGDDAYCDGVAKVCRKCESGKKNCDRKFGCECDTTCDAGACKPTFTPCSTTKAGDCGDETKYCVAATTKCDSCPAGKKNCDLVGDCTCSFTCVGTTCPTPCTYDGPNACNNDPTKWCYNGECKLCSVFPNISFFNCDHTEGCECSGGCDGTACQASCTAATCAGCCKDDTCVAIATQTSMNCGSGAAGSACAVCPLGTFCSGGSCVDCATNCPLGCCNFLGDCITEQTPTQCGKGGTDCYDCSPGLCWDGYCAT